MPAIDPGSRNTNATKPRKVRVTAKAAPPKARPVKVTVPDAGEATRTRTVARMTPDQADRERTPAQKTKDAAAVKTNVRVSREKAVAKAGRGSGTRAVKKVLKGIANADLTSTANTGAGPTVHTVGIGSGGVHFAAMEPVSRNLTVDDTTAAGSFIRNATSDAGELLVTTPSSVAHLAGKEAGAAKDIATGHPVKAAKTQIELGKELAKPYVDFAKRPVHTFTERPISTALMLAPGVRMPGRVVGKVARVTGKQTLERPAATLPHTALQETVTGSRDYVVRRAQAKADAKNPAPAVTAKQVKKRVDEHYDASKQESHRIVGEATNAAKKATKGQPKHVQQAAIDAAREKAQQVAQDVAAERFAREFGANERLSHGVVPREAAHTVRRQAVKVLDAAKTTAKQAEATHATAWANLKTARTAARSSPQLKALEFNLSHAQRDLADAQRASVAARSAHAQAVGRAQVLSRNVTGRSTPNVNGVWAAGGHGVRLAKAQVDATAKVVTDTRARIKDLNQRIADEHARPLPPLHPARQAFTNSIQARGQARATLAIARADAHAAAHTHIAAKKAMTNATLVKPAGEGRLFAHKADAATVVKKLNQASPDAPFVLRQVGPDRWAAIPKVADQRLYGTGRFKNGDMGHQGVGTSKATGAKLMRVSRGAFTGAVLPLSAKWLAGQGVEAGIRSAVAGAGPMDWLRMGKVVKELNKKQPGAGDALAARVSGGHFALTGPARDFANGKSLAEEFHGTPLAKPANVASAAGRTAPARAVKAGWSQYTRAVLGGINHVIESNARRAMAGQAVKNLGFADKHINGISDAAIEDAANGLRGTHNQVALARAVDRMYGKYQKFSPEMRSLLLHWSPFLPWTLNTVSFLTRVLPHDHPVLSALLASANVAEEDWRKANSLSLRGPHVPGFLLGSYPTGPDKYLRVAHYTPWGMGNDPVGSVSSLVLPQLLGPLENAKLGVDWKGQPLTRGGPHGPKFNTGEKLARAVVTALETHVPGISQAGAVSGLTPRYIDKTDPADIKGPGEVLKSYLPWEPATSHAPATAAPTQSSGRIRIPGAANGARIKIPGVGSGRIKIP